MTGTTSDVTRVSRQLLNRALAHRTIGKPEAVVELMELPLCLCSEVTETINISGSYKVSSDSHKDLVSQYRKIARDNPELSLYTFVRTTINEKERKLRRKYSAQTTIIPHFVGARGQPRYPPTKEYAMATLIVHKPWQGSKPRKRDGDNEWIEEFLVFVESDNCPEMVKQEYARVKERAESKRPPEAVATEETYDWETTAEVDDAVKDLLNIIATQTATNDPFLNVSGIKIDRGLDYDWSTRVTVRKETCCLTGYTRFSIACKYGLSRFSVGCTCG